RLDTKPALAQWLLQSSPTPSVGTFTDRIVKFCEDNLPEYDGISFDLEGLNGTAAQLAAATANVSGLYKQGARKITRPPFLPKPNGVDKGFDRLCAFAAGPLIGFFTSPPTKQNPNPVPTMRKSRLLQHEKDARGKDDLSKPLL